MNELIFAGNKYISSKRAGKLTGYTTDYIGQMCRGGKMDCRLVGRNWYINEEVMKAQKKSFKKAQLNEGGRAIEYKKLDLEPMYYSDDERINNPEINKVVLENTEEEVEEITEEEEETIIEIKEKKPARPAGGENLIPILSMIESPMVDLRPSKKEVAKTPVIREARGVIEREGLLPQKSPIRLPMVKVIASVIVLVGLLFVAGTLTLEQTVHYTQSESTVNTEFQVAGVGSFFSF
ncbi:hypothetical protein HON59_01375 [bacterium]|nr:hypothetical protein [bacterium]MBT3729845.1 hypothetical protein [bacterium]MBT4894700.1 hypothetical protein [bacterium]